MLKRAAEIAVLVATMECKLQRILERRNYLMFPHAASIGGCLVLALLNEKDRIAYTGF
jgi:hypothetical protein